MNWFMRTISLSFVIVSIFESKKCSALEHGDNAEWWETTMVYQLSLPFYEDSDDDGTGDLRGLINHLEYISSLGVETICLSPIYPSPFIDFGFDISDHTDVNPMYGNLSDFDDLIRAAHAYEIKIILDFIPNHTSDEHEWFQASVNMTESYDDFYIWANGTIAENGSLVPPDNSTNLEENSTWTYNEVRGQWYYHKFDAAEPDLNMENPNVLDELMLVLEFWLDRGVDGFRILGISDSYDHLEVLNEQRLWRQKNLFDLGKNLQLLYNIRTFISGWTLFNNSTSKYLVSETDDTAQNLLSYYETGVIPLNYCLIKSTTIAGTNASKLVSEISAWLNAIPLGASTNWLITDTETHRITSTVGSKRLDAVLMLSMLLPGQAFMFYGDEVGMPSLPLNKNEQELIFGSERSNLTTEAILHDERPASVEIDEETLSNIQKHLFVFKQLGQLRKKPVFIHGSWELETLNDDKVLVLRRFLPNHPIYMLVMNMAESGQEINMAKLYEDLKEPLQVVVISGANDTGLSSVSLNHVFLQPHAGVVLRSEGVDEWENVKFDNDREEAYENNSTEHEEMHQTEKIDAMENTTSHTDDPTEAAVTEIIGKISLSETTITPEEKNSKATKSATAGADALLVDAFFAISIIILNVIFSQELARFSMGM